VDKLDVLVGSGNKEEVVLACDDAQEEVPCAVRMSSCSGIEWIEQSICQGFEWSFFVCLCIELKFNLINCSTQQPNHPLPLSMEQIMPLTIRTQLIGSASERLSDVVTFESD
jgi:hypothetical protein